MKGNGILKIYNIAQFVFLCAFDANNLPVISDGVDTSKPQVIRSTLDMVDKFNACEAAPFRTIYNPVSNGFNNNRILDGGIINALSTIYNNISMTDENNKILCSNLFHDNNMTDYAYYINEKVKELLSNHALELADRDGININDLANPIESLLTIYSKELAADYVELENVYNETIDNDLIIYGRLGSNSISDLVDSGTTNLAVYEDADRETGALCYISLIYTKDCIAINLYSLEDRDNKIVTMEVAEDIIRELGEEFKLETMTITQIKEKDDEYIDYIDTHIQKVQGAFDKYGKEICRAIGADYETAKRIIENHDISKYSEEEFDGYRKKFYPAEGDFESEEYIKRIFNKAWLYHIHSNAHHPEHWVLVENGERTVFDMPKEEIVAMLCDWESFRKDDGSGGAYHYYYNVDRKENLLSDFTRTCVVMGLEVMK